MNSSPTDACQALHVKEEKYIKQGKITDIPVERSIALMVIITIHQQSVKRH